MMTSAVTIRIAATFTAEPVGGFIRFLLEKAGLAADVEFAPYGQVFQELLAPASGMRRNTNGVNAVLIRWEDLGGVQPGCLPDPAALARIEENAENLASTAESAVATVACHLVGVCPPARTTVAGADAARRIAALEEKLAGALKRVSGVHVIRTSDWLEAYREADYDDTRAERLGAMPYTERFYAAMGLVLSRRIWSLRTPQRKVIVTDCDETLWTGVCGEAGALGVHIDSGRRELQTFLLDRRSEGMLLCVCSKNNEEDALAVFDAHPDMLLRRDHLVSWRTNWQPKSENIISLASELGIGTDSMILVDDDPVVCAEVRSRLPEVITVQVPRDSARAADHVRRVWAFDRLNVTSEDRTRSEKYLENRKREELRSNSTSFADFLEQLELSIHIEPLQPADLDRVSQLTFRTNQFNCTGKRQTTDEIRRILSEGAQCWTVRVSDRFGDYGLVGSVTFLASGSEIDVETFLLSCRALGRGVEHRMLARIGSAAVDCGMSRVRVRFRRTAKNRPAASFLDSCCAERVPTGEDTFDYILQAEAASRLTCDGSAGLGETADVLRSPAPSSVASKPASALDEIAREWSRPEALIAAVRPPASTIESPADVSATADEMEGTLCRIFREQLGLPAISGGDSFFEVGGDSFQAVRVFARIEEELGLKLSIASLFEHPTPSSLAALIRRGATQDWESLVPIQPNGSGIPLFCMHAAGGNVLFYGDLARHLGAEQRVYGLQTKGLHRREVPHDRVEDMAAFYISEILAFYPDGPYLLAGSSFGGLVAWEAARQLTRSGHHVALVALFDTYGPGYPHFGSDARSFGGRINRAKDFVARYVRALSYLPKEQRLPFLMAKFQKGRKDWKRKWIYRRNEIERAFHRATGRPLPRDLQRMQRAIGKALRDYVPEPYVGRVVLFRAADQPRGAAPDPTLGWGALAQGELEVIEVPGHHGAITVDPYARFLAAALRPHLDLVKVPALVGQGV